MRRAPFISAFTNIWWIILEDCNFFYLIQHFLTNHVCNERWDSRSISTGDWSSILTFWRTISAWGNWPWVWSRSIIASWRNTTSTCRPVAIRTRRLSCWGRTISTSASRESSISTWISAWPKKFKCVLICFQDSLNQGYI